MEGMCLSWACNKALVGRHSLLEPPTEC